VGLTHILLRSTGATEDKHRSADVPPEQSSHPSLHPSAQRVSPPCPSKLYTRAKWGNPSSFYSISGHASLVRYRSSHISTLTYDTHTHHTFVRWQWPLSSLLCNDSYGNLNDIRARPFAPQCFPRSPRLLRQTGPGTSFGHEEKQETRAWQGIEASFASAPLPSSAGIHTYL
jgi:hypothetical protein